MRSAQEIKKVFGTKFNRDLKILMLWLDGLSSAQIAKKVGLCNATVVKYIHGGAKAAIFANELAYRDMPQDFSCKGYRDNSELYIKLANDALKINTKGA